MQKSSVNKIILVGHLGNKPEGRYTAAGISTANFSLATNESWIDSDNNKQERTEWHSIIAWNKLADFATEYLQKGQLIYIEGKLQSRTYNDKEDIQRRITEIIAITITPLEWKTNDQKKAEIVTNPSDNNEEKKSDTTSDTDKKEDLPF